MKCSFCHRDHEDVAYTVSGPEDRAICDECLLRVSKNILETTTDLPRKIACSFCAIADRKPHGTVNCGEVTICSRCTLAALQVIKMKGKPYRAMAEKMENQVSGGKPVDDYLRQSYEIPEPIEPSGPLEQADFEKLTREVDAFIEEQGVLNGILIHTESFPGREDFSGFTQHLKFVKDHHRKIRRIAIVSDAKLLALAPALAGHFVSAELRQFDYQEMDNAKRRVSRAA